MLPFLRNKGALLRWILSALSETAVVIPWLLVAYASNGGDEWPAALPGAWLPLLVFLAAGLWEAGDRKEDPQRRLYALGGGVVVAYLLAYQAVPTTMRSGLLHFNLAVFFIPVAAYLWYQGARSSIEGIEYGRIFSRFSVQFGALLGGILLLLLLGQAANPKVQLLLYWSVILLFAAGLSLLLLTRDRALKADQAKLGDSGTGNSVSPVMMAVVGSLTLLTLIASYTLSTDRMMAILHGVGEIIAPFFNWVFQVAMLIVVRWLILLGPLFRWLVARRTEQETEAPEGDPEGEVPPPPELGETGLPLDITPYLKAAVFVLILLVVARYLMQLVRMRRQSAEFDEERISLGFWRSLWADLKALFGLAAGRAQPAVQTAAQALGLQDRRDPRALFRRLQRWGSQKGRPRGEAETPNRYREALSERHPEAGQPSDAVTSVYNQARYGRNQPDAGAVSAAHDSLERLEKGSS